MLLFLKGKLTWGSAGMPQSLSCSHCVKGLASVSWAGDKADSPPPHPQNTTSTSSITRSVLMKRPPFLPPLWRGSPVLSPGPGGHLPNPAATAFPTMLEGDTGHAVPKHQGLRDLLG